MDDPTPDWWDERALHHPASPLYAAWIARLRAGVGSPVLLLPDADEKADEGDDDHERDQRAPPPFLAPAVCPIRRHSLRPCGP